VKNDAICKTHFKNTALRPTERSSIAQYKNKKLYKPKKYLKSKKNNIQMAIYISNIKL